MKDSKTSIVEFIDHDGYIVAVVAMNKNEAKKIMDKHETYDNVLINNFDSIVLCNVHRIAFEPKNQKN